MDSPRLPAGYDPTRHATTLWNEFRAFAFKGNMVDLAVGVIIGAAFGNVVNSLVKNILMPLIGALLPGETGYERWSVTLNGQTVAYGRFLAELVNFLVVALALFVFTVKFLGWLRRFRQEESAAPESPVLTRDQQLLTEIRDLLRTPPG